MFNVDIRVAWQTPSHRPCSARGDGLVSTTYEAKLLRCPNWVSESYPVVASGKKQQCDWREVFQDFCPFAIQLRAYHPWMANTWRPRSNDDRERSLFRVGEFHNAENGS
jgi:hypothetical protein